MRKLLSIIALLLSLSIRAQYNAESEYSFTSTGYYYGDMKYFKNDAITKSFSEIHIVGSKGDYKGIKKLTEYDPYSYGFIKAYTNEGGMGIWICSNDDYNNGLQKVIYDPKTSIIEFQFKDNISQIFIGVKRVK
jgi:hypothetical protein